jgi:hypothetical protein
MSHWAIVGLLVLLAGCASHGASPAVRDDADDREASEEVDRAERWGGTALIQPVGSYQKQLDELLAGRALTYGAYSYEKRLEEWWPTPPFRPGEPLPPLVLDVVLVSADLDGLSVHVRFESSAPISSTELVFGGDGGRPIVVSAPEPLDNGWWRASARLPWFAYTPWEPITFGIHTTRQLGFSTTLFSEPSARAKEEPSG